MGKGPEKAEQPQSERDLQAVAEWKDQHVQDNYIPILKQRRDAAGSDDFGNKLAGRANADTMQALTANMDYNPYMRGGGGEETGNMSQALTGQTALARDVGLKQKRDEQLDVLKAAHKQQSTSQKGLADLASLESSKEIRMAEAANKEKAAKYGAATQLGSSLAFQGLKNMSTGGSFFTPNDDGNPIKGWRKRAEYGMGEIS